MDPAGFLRDSDEFRQNLLNSVHKQYVYTMEVQVRRPSHLNFVKGRVFK